MDKKTKLIIGGSIAGTALAALVVGSIALANRPSALIARAAANTISDAKRIEAYAVGHDVLNGGSVAVSANLDKLANDDVYVQGKVYCDMEELKSAYELTMTEDDETVLQTRLLCSGDRIAFTCPEIIDGAYGVNIKDLAKNLPGSIFDPDEETDYSLDDDRFNYFMNLNSTLKNDKNLEHDTEFMTAKYRQLAIKLFVKYSEVGRSSKTVTIGGEKISCTLITLSVDEEALAKIMQDLVDYAQDDEELEKLIYRYASNGSLYEDVDDYIDEFYDELEEFEEEIENLENTDIDIELSFYITKSGRRLAQVDGEFEVDGESVEFSLALGKNVATSKEISLTGKDKTTGESVSCVYSVEEDSDKAYEAKFKVKSSDKRGDDVTTIKVSWDRKNGDFDLKYNDDYDNYVIKGNLKQKGDRYIFLLTNIRSGSEAVPYVKSLELTITIDRHDPVPRVPGNFSDITKMDKRSFKHLVGDIKDGFEEIYDKYFSRG